LTSIVPEIKILPFRNKIITVKLKQILSAEIEELSETMDYFPENL